MHKAWYVTIALLAAAGARAEQLPLADGGIVASENGGVDAALHADIDADGDPDLVYASRTGARVSWSRNDRSGYAPRATLFVRENVIRVLAADVDLDGRVDLVTATSGGTLAIHRGTATLADGVPQFNTRPAFATTLTGVTALASGDLNADGRADLLVGRSESPALLAFLFTGGAGPQFTATAPIALPPGVGRVAGLATADIDSNGLPDVVLTANTLPGAAQRVAQLVVIPRTGPGTFGTGVSVESAVGADTIDFEVGALAVGDFDLLNGPDVAWIFNNPGDGPSQIILRKNDAAGSMSLGNRVVIDDDADRYDSLAVSDIDHDGDLDVAFNSSAGHVGAFVQNFRTGFGQPSVLPGTVNDAIATLVLDDDLDGDLDLLAVQAGGSLRRARNTRIHGSTFVFGNLISALVDAPLEGPFEVVTRRLARTGRREALVTEFNGGRVRSVSVERTSLFTLAATSGLTMVVTNAGAAREIAVLDVDYDGDDDFVLATGESANTSAGNQNRLTFSSNAATPVNTIQTCNQGNDIRGVAVGEIFNPGMGVVYAAEDNDRIATVASCPTETLVSTPANGVPNGPGVAKLGDLDQDGDLDLLVAARLNDEGAQPGDLVGWYPNTGNGTFGALQRIGIVDGAREAVLLDFNRDGKLDVATGVAGSGVIGGTVLLYPNLGGGLFDTPVIAATGIQSPGRVSATDLDFDGDIDLLVPSESEFSRGAARTQCGISLIEARADGGYEAPICLDESDPLPWSRLAVDDLDANGVADIIATSFPDNRVCVFSLDRSQQFTGRNLATLAVVQLEGGVEQCYESLDLEHLGRPGDSDLRLSSFQVSAVAGSPGTTMLAAIVIRRDDGDRVPNPVLDAEVGRATVPTVSGTTRSWTVAPADHRLRATDGPVRFWTCALPVRTLPATADLLALRAPSVVVRDAATQAPAIGSTLGSFVQSLQSSSVFRDGLEDAVN